ncbi:MAG: adenylate kinase [Omnitrophica WOR_2 bacterium GWF2_43_52]|nr:MAG: adenylate kinase [Omnitrophica WOR_2 bacterium GWC2_44_8]OGX20328.1 MAG: adenylate kinase [Omnitrophica WOR_2 bacterium GWF2_43_52]OGX56422.1 MAG: adenylate kinase [Omnitrophica WOR_2 bacterium RIFOXYC2_FULL_43_9]HAH21238.1 adenylate kinase [Candidatus Omnitrophota bacterium]HBG63950.1 adenylate kinase [Candidatus Omnitrophota bacterium]
MKLVLLGAPGAGKGTQAKGLSKELKLAHISTGDILRIAIKENTPLGQKAKRYVETGELVPDSLVTQMVIERLSSDDVKDGFILDGFPRNRQQASDLDNFLSGRNTCNYFVLYLDASEKTLIKRLSGRRICRKCQAVYHLINFPPLKEMTCDHCQGELYQRSDDKEETIKNRLEVYQRQTAPVVEYYFKQKRLIHIKSDDDAPLVLRQMLEVLAKPFSSRS